MVEGSTPPEAESDSSHPIDVLFGRRLRWYVERQTQRDDRCLLTCTIGSLMNGLQALPAWQNDFGNPKGQLLGAVNAAQSAGSILMLPICGTLSDKIGRRWTLLLGGVMIIAASVIQSASINIAMFIVSRVVVGAGAITIIQPSPMLISELCYPTHRGIYTAMFWTCYYVGAIIASWSTYGLQKNMPDSRWAWRGPSILQGGLPLLQLLFVSHHLRSACVAKSVTLTRRISGMPCLNLLGGLSHRAVRTKPELSLRNTILEVKKITHS